MSEQLDAGVLVEAYLAIRDEREKLLRNYEAQDENLKKDQSLLEAEFLKLCNSVNVNSISTDNGIVMRKLNERFYTNDWENFSKFVIENSAVGLLERRIHQGNFREYMAGHTGEGLPPGINVMREYAITVRRKA